MKCTVTAKSRTSFERAMSIKIKITLGGVRLVKTSGRHREGELPGKTIQHPDETQRPANGSVPAQTAPAKEKIYTDLLARYQGGEDNEDRSAAIVCELKENDLGKYAGRGEIRKSARSRRAASAWHQYAGDAL